MSIRTVISSQRQNAIEASKPAFVFYFEDEPQYMARDARGKIAHMLKCYRAHPERYSVTKMGTHAYRVMTCGRNAIARIEAA
jgi:hypothetical protein